MSSPNPDPCDQFKVNGVVDVEKELSEAITVLECVYEQLGNLWGAVHLTTRAFLAAGLNDLRGALENHRNDMKDVTHEN